MDFLLPQLGEGVYEAELVRWLVSAGDSVKHGQGLLEVLTDKATMEVPAPFAGTIRLLLAQSGDKVKVGDHILSYWTTAAIAEEIPLPAPAPVKVAAPEPLAAALAPSRTRNGMPLEPAFESGPIKASPSVRHLARKLNIDLARVRGTGPAGRVLLEDIQLPLPVVHGEEKARVGSAAASRLDLGRAGSRVKLQGVRRKIAEHLVLSKNIIPHFTYVDECDLSELVRLRASLREPFERAGVKLTYLPFIVKAVVAALKEVPVVNATLDDEKGEIIHHDQYHIGIATATPVGLLVPVVHDADRKDIGMIARDIDRLSNAARAGHSKLTDLRGGTFTITSIGGIGGLLATPIINHPEVAILGIGKAMKRPVYDAAGNIKAADMVYLSISFDHRVVDGAVGAIFGNALIQKLQNPARLLLPDKLGY